MPIVKLATRIIKIGIFLKLNLAVITFSHTVLCIKSLVDIHSSDVSWYDINYYIHCSNLFYKLPHILVMSPMKCTCFSPVAVVCAYMAYVIFLAKFSVFNPYNLCIA